MCIFNNKSIIIITSTATGRCLITGTHNNMKKALLLLTALCIATLGFAQLPFATLTHNDSIRVYYGNNALQQAHAAAVGGDVITLSQGSFYSVNITKAVTIRGAGMFRDETAGTNATVLQNDFSINVSDTVNRLCITGIWHGNTITCTNAYRPQFIKCRFNTFRTLHAAYTVSTSSVIRYATFVNCILYNWSNGTNNSIWDAQFTSFLNSIIANQSNWASPDALINCVAQQEYSASYTNSKSITNSILYFNGTSVPSQNGYTSFNTIGINYSNYYYGDYRRPYFDMTNVGTHNLHNIPSSATTVNPFSTVFTTFRGTYTDGMSMALNANIATTILGNDSTQVGIYGGQFPWDPSVSNPLIGHIRAARRTNAAGLLEVDVEILDDEESDSSNTISGSDNE